MPVDIPIDYFNSAHFGMNEMIEGRLNKNVRKFSAEYQCKWTLKSGDAKAYIRIVFCEALKVFADCKHVPAQDWTKPALAYSPVGMLMERKDRQ